MIGLNILSQSNYIVLHKKLCKKIGIIEAYMLSLLAEKIQYNYQINKDFDGYVRWSRLDIEEETGLTPHQQRNIFKKLETFGYVKSKTAGLPATNYYTISNELIKEIMEEKPVDIILPDVEDNKPTINNENEQKNNNTENERNKDNSKNDRSFENIKKLFIEKGETEEEARRFFDYYEMVGWTVGRSNKKIKSIIHAVNNWINHKKQFNNNNNNIYRFYEKQSNIATHKRRYEEMKQKSEEEIMKEVMESNKKVFELLNIKTTS